MEQQPQEVPIPRVISVARRRHWPWQRTRRSALAKRPTPAMAMYRESGRGERVGSRAIPVSVR